jgi:hypothetical protein
MLLVRPPVGLDLNQAMAALEMASAEVERQVAHFPIEAPASSLS